LEDFDMSNPWDTPPLPSSADEDVNATYCGVGRVITQWEGIEAGLSRIFSMFNAKPDDYETIQAYGARPKFSYRMGAVQLAARQFFITRHDQKIEGTFDQLSEKMLGFSDRRNDVAHGILTAVQVYPWFQARAVGMKPRTNYWAILPPYHDFKKHTDMGGKTFLMRLPEFAYTSIELLALEQKLISLYGELSSYREELRMLIAKHG
jgi:hypothetical protein